MLVENMHLTSVFVCFIQRFVMSQQMVSWIKLECDALVAIDTDNIPL